MPNYTCDRERNRSLQVISAQIGTRQYGYWSYVQTRKKVLGLSGSSRRQSTGFPGRTTRKKRLKIALNRQDMHQNHQSGAIAP